MQRKRRVFLLIVGENKKNQSVEDTHETVQNLKKSLGNEVKKIKINAAGMNDPIILAKILEIVFKDEKTEIEIKGVRPEENELFTTVKGRKRDKRAGRATNNKKERETEAIIIKKGEKSFAEVLREIKSSVDPAGMGLTIRETRKTRAGDILIAFEKKENGVEALRDAISNIGGKLEVKKPQRRESEVVYIKGLDALTTAEDVQNEIVKEIGQGETTDDINEIKVLSLKTVFGETQNATVALPRTYAERLIKKGALQIGWAKCLVRKREEVTRCFKCLGLGHKAELCKGPDRSDLCLRCGEPGHRAKECKNEMKCILCNKEKHATNTTRCPFFRAQLAKQVKRAREREKSSENAQISETITD